MTVPDDVDVDAVARRFLRTRRLGTLDVIADSLRESIVCGELPPGSRLGESALAERLDVSRNTLREVLRILEAEGLVERRPHRGVFIRALTLDDVRDVYRIRRLVEVDAVRRASEAPRELLDELHEAVVEATSALAEDDPVAMGTADVRFHSAVTALCGSARLTALMDRLSAELRLAFAQVDSPMDFHRAYVERNAALVALLEEGRYEDAAAEMEDYLDTAESDLISRAFGQRGSAALAPAATSPASRPSRR